MCLRFLELGIANKLPFIHRKAVMATYDKNKPLTPRERNKTDRDIDQIKQALKQNNTLQQFSNMTETMLHNLAEVAYMQTGVIELLRVLLRVLI